jgi:hypothetical protein
MIRSRETSFSAARVYATLGAALEIDMAAERLEARAARAAASIIVESLRIRADCRLSAPTVDAARAAIVVQLLSALSGAVEEADALARAFSLGLGEKPARDSVPASEPDLGPKPDLADALTSADPAYFCCGADAQGDFELVAPRAPPALPRSTAPAALLRASLAELRLESPDACIAVQSLSLELGPSSLGARFARLEAEARGVAALQLAVAVASGRIHVERRSYARTAPRAVAEAGAPESGLCVDVEARSASVALSARERLAGLLAAAQRAAAPPAVRPASASAAPHHYIERLTVQRLSVDLTLAEAAGAAPIVVAVVLPLRSVSGCRSPRGAALALAALWRKELPDSALASAVSRGAAQSFSLALPAQLRPASRSAAMSFAASAISVAAAGATGGVFGAAGRVLAVLLSDADLCGDGDGPAAAGPAGAAPADRARFQQQSAESDWEEIG